MITLKINKRSQRRP